MFITLSGGSSLTIGLVGGLRDGVTSILKVFCGYWSDRTGKRKRFVVAGYLLSGVFKLLLSLCKGWQQILIFASLERVGKGLRTAPRDAIIADSMPRERGKGFGIHRAFDTAGAIVGSILVFILFWFLHLNFRIIIFISALLAFFSLLPLHSVKEEKREGQDITLRMSFFKTFPSSLKWFIVVSGVFNLSNISYMFFILRVQEFFLFTKEGVAEVQRLAVAIPILLYILFNIFYAGFAIPFGVLSDRVGRKRMLISGYLLFSLISLGFALFSSLPAFILLFILYGVVYAIIAGNQRAYIADLSPEQAKATALGIFHTFSGLCALLASLLAGFLWHNLTYTATFLYASIMSALSVILFLVKI